MAEGSQAIDQIGVALTLDTSQFDARIAAANTKAKAFETERTRVLRAPQSMDVTPRFQVTQQQVRGLRVDINQHLSSLAARNEAVAVPVKLGNSDWGAIRQQIAQKIGTVPISVTISGNQPGLKTGARGAASAGTDPVQVLAAWIAQTQGLSLPNAQTQLVRSARSKGITGRARGGPVVQDRDYLVGENGPEIIRPKQAGTVLPRGGGGHSYRYSGGGFAQGGRPRLARDFVGPPQQYIDERTIRGAFSGQPQGRAANPWLRHAWPRPDIVGQPRPVDPLTRAFPGADPFPGGQAEVERGARFAALFPHLKKSGMIPHAGGGEVKPISYGPGFAHKMAGGPVTKTFTVADPNGLHMRPSGALTRAVARYQAEISAANLTNGQELGNPNSIYSWMTLGARKGHKIQVTADGSDARAAMDTFAKLLRFNPEKTGTSYRDFYSTLGMENPMRRQKGGAVFKKHATDLEEWKRNLLTHARGISSELVASAMDWYPIARAQALGDLADFGREGSTPNIAAFASASPGQPWPNNRAILREILEKGAATTTVHRDVPGFGMTKATAPYGYSNWAKAAKILQTGDTSLLSGPKVVPFFGNLSGQDPEAWTLDARQMRIASANRITSAPGGGSWQRQILEKAHEDVYPQLQEMWGVKHRSQAQAILWAGYGRGEDLGSDFARTESGITIPRHPGILVPRRGGGRMRRAAGGAYARMLRTTAEQQGGTFDVRTGQSPTKGYAVGIHEGDFRNPSTRDIRAMMEALRDAEQYGAPYVGTWMHEGQLAVDPVNVLSNKREAMRLGRSTSQQAIYDIRRQQEIMLKRAQGGFAMGGYCTTCRTSPRSMAEHVTTATHRRATTPRLGRAPIKRDTKKVPSWMRGTGWDPLPDEAYEDNYATGGRARRGQLPRGYSVEFLDTDADRPIKHPPSWITHANFEDFMDPDSPSAERLLTTVVRDKRGEFAGSAPFKMGFSEGKMFLHPEMTEVAPKHRGRGLANAMYATTERFTGREIMPSEVQTAFGKALWAQKNRPFGKSFGDRPMNLKMYRDEGWLRPENAIAEEKRELHWSRERSRQSSRGWHNMVPGRDDPTTCSLCGAIPSHHGPKMRGARGEIEEVDPLARLNTLMGPVVGGEQFAPGYSSAAAEYEQSTRPLVLSSSSGHLSAPIGRALPQTPEETAEFTRQLLKRRRYAAGGHPDGKGTYLVGELNPELFVPDRLKYIIPPDVMDKLPKRDEGGSVRKMGSGVMEIGTKGPHLWQPPEDGWIIPHTLTSRVGPHIPRAQGGARHSTRDPVTGRFMSEAEARQRGLSGRIVLSAEQIEERVAERRELMAQQAVGHLGAAQTIAGRSPTSVLAGIATGPGRQAALQNLAQYNLAARKLNTFYERHADVIEQASIDVAQGHPISQEHNEILQTHNDLLKKTVDAEKKVQPTVSAYVKNFGAVLGANVAYGLAMQAAQVVMEAVVPAGQRWIDSQTGFTATNQRITRQLGEGLRQSGGDLGAVIGGVGGQAGVGGAGLTFLQRALGGGAFAKAGAAAEGEKSDLFKAAAGIGAPTGLVGGYGGLFGGALFAQQLGGGMGLAETIGKTAGELEAAARPAADRLILPPQKQPGEPGYISPISRTGIEFRARNRGDVPAPAIAALGGRYEPVPRTPEQMASLEALNTYTTDLNDAMSRGAFAAGETAGHFVNVGKEAAKAEDWAKNLGTEAQSMQAAGLVLKNANGDIITDQREYQKALGQLAQGDTIQSLDAWSLQIQRSLKASRQATEAQTRQQIDVGIPGGLAMQLAAQPLLTRRQLATVTGVNQPGVSNRPAIRRSMGEYMETRQDLQAEARAGRQAMVAQITEYSGAAQAQEFSGYLKEAAGYGREIVALQTRMAKINMAQSAREFAANMILAARALRDALGLAGRAGGSRFGQLQRQDYFLGRESQAISMGLQQKQINFQVATAGFTSQGQTAEELAARQKQTKVEASYAQQQLDIERSRFEISLQLFNISNERAVADARRSKDLLQASFENQKRMQAIIQEIHVKEMAQTQAMNKANAIFEASNRNFGSILNVGAERVAKFAGSLGDAIVYINHVLRTGTTTTELPGRSRTGDRKSRQEGLVTGASGLLGFTAGETSMIIGEAGREGVAIIKNPRMASMSFGGGGGGGGGAMTLTLNINGPIHVRDDSDISKIAAAVEERINRRVSLLGLRRPGG